jgi:adenylosuccinate synthase
LQGWKTSLSDIRKYEDLPENAKKYISRVEDLIGAPIGIISVGPDREQTIFINE